MKQLIQHEQCLRCRECCRFREDRQYFAPLFTASEIDRIRAKRSDLPEFRPFKESDRVFQIQLKRSTMPDAVYPYVCPFLDEENYLCTIYDERPFDCQTWPFIVHKVEQTGSTLVAYFTGDVCLALKEVDPADFEEYQAYFVALVTSEKYLQVLRDHPELIWVHNEDGVYHTVSLADISTALSPESDAAEPPAAERRDQ
ncbi:MAG: YkgJ family cysteine cluster protein [Chloroflexota bacterium]|nr:MAG: hypothetical protein DIU68_11995 [Chloroflexota bacterium]